TVDYASSDGTANQRTDYNLLLGTLSFAPGETQKTLTLLVTEDSYVEGSETLNLNLSNVTGAAALGAQSQAQVTITDNDSDPNAPNAIIDTPNFVRQQYHDFLNREPDPPGFTGWQSILNNCPQSGKDSNGIFCDRIEVSSAFFRSLEFHDRGYFIYRFYSTGFGRIPKYTEFMRDMQKVSGFLNDQQQEQAKVSFINEFMARSEFKQKYDPVVDAAAYVDALSQTAGVTLSNRNQIVQQLQTSQITRGQALRMVVESAEVDQKFYNEAFVIMQYFGYLRRDADILYQQWIQTLNQTKDYRVLVNGFLNSTEYVLRFGK
ncbi:MAG TPA: Calx-beta domain-containing protein, partial [Pyrinomonadaceae bacterium]|nr:Calx-beta domain-containing protein [Pyrinomonadaceae bacterium]